MLYIYGLWSIDNEICAKNVRMQVYRYRKAPLYIGMFCIEKVETTYIWATNRGFEWKEIWIYINISSSCASVGSLSLASSCDEILFNWSTDSFNCGFWIQSDSRCPSSLFGDLLGSKEVTISLHSANCRLRCWQHAWKKRYCQLLSSYVGLLPFCRAWLHWKITSCPCWL